MVKTCKYTVFVNWVLIGKITLQQLLGARTSWRWAAQALFMSFKNSTGSREATNPGKHIYDNRCIQPKSRGRRRSWHLPESGGSKRHAGHLLSTTNEWNWGEIANMRHTEGHTLLFQPPKRLRGTLMNAKALNRLKNIRKA